MQFDEFCKAHTEVWHRYLKKFYVAITRNEMVLQEGKILFPNLVLYTETSHHYLAELFGSSSKYKSLVPRRHVESSTLKYLYQFADTEDNPMFLMNARCNSLRSLLLSRDIDESKVKQRFGIDVRKMYTSHLSMAKDGGSLLSFGPEFRSCYLDNCLLVNTHQEIYRIKSILNLTVVSKNMSLLDFLEDMRSLHPWPVQSTLDLLGVYYIPRGSAWAYMLSGQFANLFLVPSLREQNIGEFLQENPIFLRTALNCVDFLYEQQLEWQEGNPNPDEKYIQPDLLLKLVDGHWDICDLKRPLLEKKKITKGEHSRRRFLDYVAEGIAQLANYEHYFSFKGNSQYASRKYGISVDNPKLILIVGNYENVDMEDIRQASRMLKPNYLVMDYDTVNASFLLRAYSG
jgi:hypothetical protein